MRSIALLFGADTFWAADGEAAIFFLYVYGGETRGRPPGPHAAEAERRVPARPGGEAHGGNIELSSRIGGGQPLHGDAAAGGKRLENSSLKRR